MKNKGTKTVKVERDAFLEMFEKSILDQNRTYSGPNPVINLVQNGEIYPVLTEQSFSLWHGKKKAKKTTTLAMAVAAYISEETSQDKIKFERSGIRGKIIFVDTEQGESYAAKTMNLILKLAGLKKSQNLLFCNFREHTPKERMKMLESAIQNYDDVKIVVIDGLVDFMDDFQDAKGAQDMIRSLSALCSEYKIHIAGVLHQNKTDRNPRSHIGTICTQKCEIEISCEKDSKDLSRTIIKCEDARGKQSFKDIAIKWEKDKLPYIEQLFTDYSSTQTEKFRPENLSIEEHKSILKNIFSSVEKLNDSQLKCELKKQKNLLAINKISESLAREFVAYWISQGLITSKNGPRNSKLYQLTEIAC